MAYNETPLPKEPMFKLKTRIATAMPKHSTERQLVTILVTNVALAAAAVAVSVHIDNKN